jgi:hypothetical protein
MLVSRVLAASLLGLAFLASQQSCSAGGSSQGNVGVSDDGSQQVPVLPPPTGQGSVMPGNGSGFQLEDESQLIDENAPPPNVGSETACDGIDENGNGITDDVDKGRDGLCDCLNIGFFGALASSNGNATGAFEAWLEARSDVPVRHIGARDTITADLLRPLQVLVVGNLSERGNAGFSAAELEALRNWIEVEGGGLMTLAGYTGNANDMAPTVALLAPTGMSYDYQGRGAGVLGVVMNGPPPVIVTDIPAPDHPSMEGIKAMGVFNAYPVVGDGQVIVRSGMFNLAMAKELGTGHVYVFSDEWITQDQLWSPMARPLTQCQQSCNQCANQCNQCDNNCSNCQMQPCQGGQQPPDGGTCARGCDQACTQCTNNCNTCEAACAACSALEQDQTLDIPRFWLNVFRWLTPANECQVPVPTTIVY